MAYYTKTVREDKNTILHLQIDSGGTPSKTALERYKKHIATGDITEAEAACVVACDREIVK